MKRSPFWRQGIPGYFYFSCRSSKGVLILSKSRLVKPCWAKQRMKNILKQHILFSSSHMHGMLLNESKEPTRHHWKQRHSSSNLNYLMMLYTIMQMWYKLEILCTDPIKIVCSACAVIEQHIVNLSCLLQILELYLSETQARHRMFKVSSDFPKGHQARTLETDAC